MVLTFAYLGLLGYIGPGAGMGLLGALIGLAVAVGSALSFVLLWPLRKLLRRRRPAASEPAASSLAQPRAAKPIDG